VLYNYGVCRAGMMTAFWDTAPCSLVETDRRFRSAYCLLHQGDSTPHLWKAISLYQTARRSIPDDNHLHTRLRQNLKSHFRTAFVKNKKQKIILRLP
jgi:hypothetical protein